jgi:photosystem II stability/assembly factor-like uncharacterized protein
MNQHLIFRPGLKIHLILLFIAFSQIVVSQNFNQSLIVENGVPFTGIAKFKFLIFNDTISIWSNDGSSQLLEEPRTAVSLQVIDGFYFADLGQIPMQPIFEEVIQQYSNLRLCTWVDIGNGFTVLSDTGFSLQNSVSLNNSQRFTLNLPDDNFASSMTGNMDEKIENEENEAKNPEERYKQWFMQHADIKGNIPFDGLIKAKEHIDKMPQTKDAGLWNWEWLGPSNIGGRVRAIAIKPNDPNIIYIGSASGGLWRTTNGGTSWNVINDFMPSLSISSIVYDPINSNIMYLGTGEGNAPDGIPGAGIFKSSDGGSTWSQLASTNNNNFKFVFRLAHHPDSTGVLYATTYSPRGLWKTIDGGNNWIKIFTPKFFAEDIKISPHNHAHLMVGANGGAYRSTNYGHSWDTITNNDTLNGKLPRESGRCEIAYCQANANRIFLSMARNEGELYRSNDNGLNWVLVSDTSFFKKQGNYDQALWVDPNNSDHIIVGGIRVWSSTDGGSSFGRLNNNEKYHNNSEAYSAHSDQHVIIESPYYDGVTNKTIFVGNDGGIQRNDNVFDTIWTNLAGTSLGITQFYGGAASSDGHYIIGGTQDNNHLRYKDSGDWSGKNNWYQWIWGDGGYCAIDSDNPEIQYSEYVNLEIKKSINGGNTFRNKFNGLTDATTNLALFIAPFVMDPNNPKRLIAGSNRIWETIDTAESWHPIGDVIPGEYKCSAIDIARQNSNIIWAGYTKGTIMVSTNSLGGTPTWDSVNTAALPSRYVTDICINPNNSQEVYITYGGFNADNVWFTSDGGSTWENRSGIAPYDLPAIQVNTVRVHQRNSNWVYIGTDIGVFASEDKGLNWAVDPRYSDAGNEIPANVTVSELFWQGTDYLIAATHGRGMYRALPLYTIYVDKNASSGGNGTQLAPYQTVLQAANAAGPGAVISIAANTYDENNILFTRKIRVITTNGATIIK